MSDKESQSVQEDIKDDDAPPPYAEQADVQPPQGHQIQRIETANYLAPSCTPHRPFPPSLVAIYSWDHWKGFYLCDQASSNEKLFYAQVHTGYSGKPPLGPRPGVQLHDGTRPTDPVLAASGDESQASSRVYAFNNRSVVLLPALEQGPNSARMDTERMLGLASDEHGAAWRFSVEVGKREHREKFEWRKIKKGSDENFHHSAFKLVRLSSRVAQYGTNSGDDGVAGQSSPGISSQEGETVAMLAMCGPSFTKMFTVNLLGSARSGEVGQRATLMIVVTALRLWAMGVKGKTTKTFNSTAQKIRSQ